MAKRRPPPLEFPYRKSSASGQICSEQGRVRALFKVVGIRTVAYLLSDKVASLLIYGAYGRILGNLLQQLARTARSAQPRRG